MANLQDSINDLSQAISVLNTQLSRTGSAFQTGANTINSSVNVVGGSLRNVGAGMAKLRTAIDQGRGSIAGHSQSLRYLQDEYDALSATLKRSSAGQAILADQQKMAGELLRRAIGEQAAEISKTTIAGSIELLKNQLFTGIKLMQENAGGMQLAFGLQNRALQDQISLLDRLNAGLTSAAATLALVPHPYAKAGAALAGFGAAITDVLSQAKKLESEGLVLLQTEILKSSESFKIATNAGALFAGGMTEFREVAASAKLDLKELASVTALNAEQLGRLGGTTAKGVEKFGRVNAELDRNRIGLLNLGFSYEQQAQATIDYMDVLQRTGQLQGKTEKELADGTAKYLTNLRAVSALTGEDAKKLAQRQKEANSQAAVQAMLAEGGKDVTQKFNDLVGKFPGYEKAIQQLYTVGEVTDPMLATFLANNQELDQALRQGVDRIKDNNISTDEAFRANEKYLAENGKAIEASGREAQRTFGTIALVSGQYAEQADLANKATAMGVKNAERAAQGGESALDQANRLAATTDALTGAVNVSQKAFVDAATTLNREVTPVITDFATKGALSVKGMVETINEANKRTREAISVVTGVQSILRPGNAAGVPNRTELDRLRNIPGSDRAAGAIQGGEFARGGIATGPESGFSALLHGMEAVVPLPGNRAIPVNFKYEETAGIAKQLNDSFALAMSEFNKKNVKTEQKTTETGNKLDQTKPILESVTANNGELTKIMADMKNQLVDGTKQQLMVMQQQISKMDDMITALRDNVDTSRRIANELG